VVEHCTDLPCRSSGSVFAPNPGYAGTLYTLNSTYACSNSCESKLGCLNLLKPSQPVEVTILGVNKSGIVTSTRFALWLILSRSQRVLWQQQEMNFSSERVCDSRWLSSPRQVRRASEGDHCWPVPATRMIRLFDEVTSRLEE